MQGQLVTVQAEAANLRRANEGLAGRLAEVARLQYESASWARGSTAIVQVNSSHYAALQEAVIATVELVQPEGTGFLEKARELPTRIR